MSCPQADRLDILDTYEDDYTLAENYQEPLNFARLNIFTPKCGLRDESIKTVVYISNSLTQAPTTQAPTTQAPTTHTCSSDQWQCGDGSCIRADFLCDAHTDCADGSDEYTGCGSKSFCLPVFLPTCLPIVLSSFFLSACLSSFLHSFCLPAYRPFFILSDGLPIVFSSFFLSACLSSFLPVCMLACLPVCMPAYIPSCLPARLPA